MASVQTCGYRHVCDALMKRQLRDLDLQQVCHATRIGANVKYLTLLTDKTINLYILHALQNIRRLCDINTRLKQRTHCGQRQHDVQTL